MLRIRGAALARIGDRDGAAAVLREALEAARERGEPYEILVALDVLVAMGGPGAGDLLGERDALRDSLDVLALPSLLGAATV